MNAPEEPSLWYIFEGCSVSSSTYMRNLCAMFLADNWLWMVAPVALCGILAVWFDVRFVIIALMVLFVALPMVLSLLYFYYGFSPEARWSIMEKRVTIDAVGISLSFTDERMKTHVIRWDDVRYIVEKDDVLLLMLKGKRYSCLMLPTSVEDPSIAQRLRQLIAQSQ